MSLESAYLFGHEEGSIREKIRVENWEKYPILVLKIEKINENFKFAGIDQKNPGSINLLPTSIEGKKDPYIPSLIGKIKLKFNEKDDDSKKKKHIQKFYEDLTKKIQKLYGSVEKMKNTEINSVSEFAEKIASVLREASSKKQISEEIKSWAELSATNNSEGINGFVLCVSVDGKLAEDLPQIDLYLTNASRKKSSEHAGKKVEGTGRCAWCKEEKSLSPRMDYWKSGTVDNPFSAPYGRKEDTYKVLPICFNCHDRLKAGMKILSAKYTSKLGGGIQVLFAPRIMYEKVKHDLHNEIEELWKQLEKEILMQVQVGASQLSRRGEKVISLRGIATKVDDLADMLENECLTFDVTWMKKEQSAEIILQRAYDIVPTWLLKLAEITDRVNNNARNTKWSWYAGICEQKYSLVGKHFWSLFPPPDKGRKQYIKTKPLKTTNLPWNVAAEVLEKRVRPFHEYLPDFFAGVDTYWCTVEEKERGRAFEKGFEKSKIYQWLSLWHKFSFYIYLLRKEASNMESVGANTPVETNLSSQDESEQYARKVINAAIQEADNAKVYKTKTEKGAFLAGIALGMLAIYQDKDGKTMRVLDYPGDYRLGETAYKEFMLRFGDKLRDYLYVKDFKESKGSILHGLLGASTERTEDGFDGLTPEMVGFALLSGILRASYYYYMPGN